MEPWRSRYLQDCRSDAQGRPTRAVTKGSGTTLTLARREITGRNLAWALARHPFATLNVLRRIYGQALRLWLKRIPFHAHPATRAEEPLT